MKKPGSSDSNNEDYGVLVERLVGANVPAHVLYNILTFLQTEAVKLPTLSSSSASAPTA